MRKSNWTPAIVPRDEDRTVYLVLDVLGRIGRIRPEADVGTTDLETVTAYLLSGQYKNPIHVVAFDTVEAGRKTSRPMLRTKLRNRCDRQLRDVPFFLQDFVDQHEGRYHDVQLPRSMRLV